MTFTFPCTGLVTFTEMSSFYSEDKIAYNHLHTKNKKRKKKTEKRKVKVKVKVKGKMGCDKASD